MTVANTAPPLILFRFSGLFCSFVGVDGFGGAGFGLDSFGGLGLGFFLLYMTKSKGASSSSLSTWVGCCGSAGGAGFERGFGMAVFITVDGISGAGGACRGAADGA